MKIVKKLSVSGGFANLPHHWLCPWRPGPSWGFCGCPQTPVIGSCSTHSPRSTPAPTPGKSWIRPCIYVYSSVAISAQKVYYCHMYYGFFQTNIKMLINYITVSSLTAQKQNPELQ